MQDWAQTHMQTGTSLKRPASARFQNHGIPVEPGKTKAQDMIELGGYIRDIFRLNEDNKNFRILDPTKACPTVFTAYLRQKTVTGTVN